MPEYAAIHSQILHDALARLDKTCRTFFHQLANDVKSGFPRTKPSMRYHSFTHSEYGNDAQLDNGMLVLTTLRRIRVQWSRPIEGAPITVIISRDPDG
jgi:putative transposase